MPDELRFDVQPPLKNSEYRWLNINRHNVRVGKVRGRVENGILYIHSIMIFPEFEGNNYGRKTIEVFKERFPTIVADRVRPTAIGFWEKMGFSNNGDDSFVFSK